MFAITVYEPCFARDFNVFALKFERVVLTLSLGYSLHLRITGFAKLWRVAIRDFDPVERQ